MSVTPLSSGHDGSVNLWEVDSFGSRESNEIKHHAGVLKNSHGVPTFVLANSYNNVSDTSSMIGLTPTPPMNFLKRTNQYKHLIIKTAYKQRVSTPTTASWVSSLYFHSITHGRHHQTDK